MDYIVRSETVVYVVRVCVCVRERERERKEKGWRVEGRRGQEVVYIAWRERKREIERVCM